MTSHNFEWKKNQVEELKALVSNHAVVAVAELDRFPASMFQILRKALKGKAVMKVSKNRVIKKAFEDQGIGSDFLDKILGSVVVIFTDMNPFELYTFIKKNEGKTFASSGMIAENDIVVPAGDSGLPPGPALSELKAAGIKTKLEGPTIQIAKDCVVTKKGEVITPEVASALQKLEIKTVNVRLNLTNALEGKDIFARDILDIDTEQVFNDFVSAHNKAFNLAFNSGIVMPQNIELFIAKAFTNSKALAIEAGIMNNETVKDLLGKANIQASALKSMVKEPVSAKEAGDEAKEEVKAEEKEENKEEVKEESKEEAKDEVKEEPKEEAGKEEPKEEPKPDSEEEASEIPEKTEEKA